MITRGFAVKALLSAMLNETPNPLARILSRAAAVLSFFRASRDPSIDSRQAAALAQVDKRKWSAQLLKSLEWRRFEELSVAYFEALGYQSSIARSATRAGLDIRLIAAGAKDASLVLLCKAWDAYRVGIKAARELRAAMTAAGLAEGVLITAGRFTPEAAAYAREQSIRLIDGVELLAGIAALAPEKARALLEFATEGDFLTPTCPSCSLKMISRKSTKEGRKFWGCRNYPRCKQMFADAAHTPA
jgi:restriction system protein